MSPLEESFAYCEYVAKTQAKNFYYSFLTLPADRKAAMCAVYAFFRYSDDVSDEMVDRGDKPKEMREWKEALDRALVGDYGDSKILPAFHETVRKYQIPPHYFYELIEGTEMDLTMNRYETFDQLYRYCYLVACVVGFVCVHIWGFDPDNGRALEYAESCGLAFQLTNILRDIKEDAERDRIYVPLEDLRHFSMTEEELKQGTMTDKFTSLMEFEVQRANTYYTEAEKLLPLIDSASRPTYRIMIGIYRGILDSIRANNFDVHTQRARVSTPRKLGIVARAWISGKRSQ